LQPYHTSVKHALTSNMSSAASAKLLLEVASSGDLAAARRLLKQGARAHERVRVSDALSLTPALAALLHGDMAMVSVLIKDDLDARISVWHAPVHVALMQGKHENLRQLLGLGASGMTLTADAKMPLELATNSDDVTELLKHGASLQGMDYETGKRVICMALLHKDGPDLVHTAALAAGEMQDGLQALLENPALCRDITAKRAMKIDLGFFERAYKEQDAAAASALALEKQGQRWRMLSWLARPVKTVPFKPVAAAIESSSSHTLSGLGLAVVTLLCMMAPCVGGRAWRRCRRAPAAVPGYKRASSTVHSSGSTLVAASVVAAPAAAAVAHVINPAPPAHPADVLDHVRTRIRLQEAMTRVNKLVRAVEVQDELQDAIQDQMDVAVELIATASSEGSAALVIGGLRDLIREFIVAANSKLQPLREAPYVLSRRYAVAHTE
jgi:hypothetical protein